MLVVQESENYFLELTASKAAPCTMARAPAKMSSTNRSAEVSWPGCGIPDSQRGIARDHGGQAPAVRTEQDLVVRPLWNAQPQRSLPGARLPNVHGRVTTRDRQAHAVGAEGQAVQRFGMLQFANFLAGDRIPENEERIFPGGSEKSSFGTIGHRLQSAFVVATEFMEKFSRDGIPDLDRAVSLG